MMIVHHHRPDNGHGWRLDLKQCYDPGHLVPGRRPLVIVPGYGMNAFIFGFHPSGTPMERYLVEAGFEVWSVNMRGQGNAEHLDGPRRYGFVELALVDLPCIFDTVQAHTRTDQPRLDVVGCSLGATLTYIYLAHHRGYHPVGAFAAIGGPLRWDKIHPAVRVLFTSARLAGAVPIRGTRKMARMVLPIARRVPALLSIYMNTRHVDVNSPDQLVRTVEDPDRRLNKQMARWIQRGDLVVNDLNISDAMASLDVPLMCIYGNADGIVPPAAARSILSLAQHLPVEVLEVGDRAMPFSHADLFISHHAQKQVFQPLSRWMASQAPA